MKFYIVLCTLPLQRLNFHSHASYSHSHPMRSRSFPFPCTSLEMSSRSFGLQSKKANHNISTESTASRDELVSINWTQTGSNATSQAGVRRSMITRCITGWTIGRTKIKGCVQLFMGNPSQSHGASPHLPWITQCYLPSDTGECLNRSQTGQ